MKTPMEILEQKIQTSKYKVIRWAQQQNRRGRRRISDLEDRTIEFTQSEKYKLTEKMNRASGM